MSLCGQDNANTVGRTPKTKGEYCCVAMNTQLNYNCKQCGPKCPDIVVKIGSGGTYSLVAANAFYRCTYCPWCGTKLKQKKDKEKRTPCSFHKGFIEDCGCKPGAW